MMDKACVDGKLVKQLQVQPGATVEVKFDEEDLQDIWFPATVVEDVGDNSFSVEYLGSIECGLVKVVVDYFHIRKPPPSMRRESFELLEKVDWFNGFGWYSGVVTKVLGDGSYIVFFKSTRKEKKLSLEDMRPHIDWVDCNWVNLPEFDNEDKHPTPNISTLKTNQKEEGAGNIEKSPNDSRSMSNKRIKTRKTVVYMRGNPIMKSKGEPQNDALLFPEISPVKAVEPGGSKTETVKDSLTQAGGGNQSSAELNGNGQMETEIKHSELKENQSTKRRRGRPTKKLAGTPHASGAAVGEVEANDVAETPIVLGLLSGTVRKPVKVGSMSRLNKVKAVKAVKDDKNLLETVSNHEENKETSMKDGKNHDEWVSTHEENKEQTGSNLIIPKRKRGRPAKVKVDGSSSTQAVSVAIGQSSAGAQLSSSHEVGLAVYNSVPTQNKHPKLVRPIGNQTTTLINAHRKNERSPRSTLGKRQRRRRKRKILNGAFMTAVDQPQAQVLSIFQSKSESLAQDIQDVLPLQLTHGITNGSTDDREPSAVSNISDDDKPLSTWFEGAQSLQESDDASISHSRSQRDKQNQNQTQVQVVDRCTEAAPERDIVVTGSVLGDGIEPGTMNNAIVPVIESIAVDHQNMPFDKSTLVWKTIQSMEVFRVLPQRPHFLPLYNCKEETREGLAIGNMVTFAGLVEKVSKFQLDDPRTILDSSMETLADLEKHGFNVEVVRARLKQLISIKRMQEEHLNSRLEIENQIVDRTLKRTKIQEEISKIDKKIAELQEKRSTAVASEERKTSELHALESSVVDINASIECSRAKFERVASSPW
ncbi:hypothetical protein Droror1_Dr00017981 [Drosera rotundifolia]